jgi:hypothetical protein
VVKRFLGSHVARIPLPLVLPYRLSDGKGRQFRRLFLPCTRSNARLIAYLAYPQLIFNQDWVTKWIVAYKEDHVSTLICCQPPRVEQFLNELLEYVSDPIHKRLIAAYTTDSPVTSMESELADMLNEVLQNEDK